MTKKYKLTVIREGGISKEYWNSSFDALEYKASKIMSDSRKAGVRVPKLQISEIFEKIIKEWESV